MECGVYEPLPPSLLPPLYLAYGTDAGEPTEVLHNDLRARYERGDPDVVRAMSEFAELAQQARDALVAGRPELLGPLMNRNFDLRQSICRLPRHHVRMVQVAREVGASAKFAGSGGAIVGVYEGEAMYADLQRELDKIGCRVLKPNLG